MCSSAAHRAYITYEMDSYPTMHIVVRTESHYKWSLTRWEMQDACKGQIGGEFNRAKSLPAPDLQSREPAASCQLVNTTGIVTPPNEKVESEKKYHLRRDPSLSFSKRNENVLARGPLTYSHSNYHPQPDPESDRRRFEKGCNL